MLLLLASLASLVAAPGDIIVNGQRPADDKVVQAYVNTITEPSKRQVARFHDAVCPRAIGLTPSGARMVENRIRETARGVGAEVANGNCTPNLMLIVAESGSKLVESLREQRPEWLYGVTGGQLRAMISDRSPVRAWSVTSVHNANGLDLIGDRGPPTLRVMDASVMNLPTRIEIDGSMIVIDNATAASANLAQLADYAAMRGLARTRPSAGGSVNTILRLFSDGGRAPAEMTSADIAYLQSLYRSPGTSSEAIERARIARELVGSR